MSEKKHTAILIGSDDSVATVIRNVEAGETVTYFNGDILESVVAADNIPIYHKIAIKNVALGGQVIKYSEVIGVAKKDISVGEHVHTQNIMSEV